MLSLCLTLQDADFRYRKIINSNVSVRCESSDFYIDLYRLVKRDDIALVSLTNAYKEQNLVHNWRYS